MAENNHKQWGHPISKKISASIGTNNLSYSPTPTKAQPQKDLKDPLNSKWG
jgi:hypothetical protein